MPWGSRATKLPAEICSNDSQRKNDNNLTTTVDRVVRIVHRMACDNRALCVPMYHAACRSDGGPACSYVCC